MNTTELVKKIHNEFNTASEKLLVNNKHKQLLDIGFINAKGVNKSLVQLCQNIKEYSILYPKYKFISNDDIAIICKKYHLVYAPIDRYKGDVPQKNLNEILTFLTEMGERKILEGLIHYDISNSSDWHLNRKFRRWAHKQPNTTTFEETVEKWVEMGGDKSDIKSVKTKLHKTKDLLYICAPKKDMILKGLIFSGLSYNVPDPVVICKVPKGGLIISAWGDEAEEEIVFNEINN